MRRWLVALFLVVLGLALGTLPLVRGQGSVPPASQSADLALGPQGGEATLSFPFQLAADAEVYAKLLPTPGNPAVGNGTVAGDRSAGLSGWWVHLVLEPDHAAPVDLGTFADAGASGAAALPAGAVHALRVTAHAPADAGPAGSAFRVDLALAHRDEGGAAVDPSWGFHADLTVASSLATRPALDVAGVLPLLGLAAGVAALGALLAARRARGPRDWL
jgi:hypothetical protein